MHLKRNIYKFENRLTFHSVNCLSIKLKNDHYFDQSKVRKNVRNV